MAKRDRRLWRYYPDVVGSNSGYSIFSYRKVEFQCFKRWEISKSLMYLDTELLTDVQRALFRCAQVFWKMFFVLYLYTMPQSQSKTVQFGGCDWLKWFTWQKYLTGKSTFQMQITNERTQAGLNSFTRSFLPLNTFDFYKQTKCRKKEQSVMRKGFSKLAH